MTCFSRSVFRWASPWKSLLATTAAIALVACGSGPADDSASSADAGTATTSDVAPPTDADADTAPSNPVEAATDKIADAEAAKSAIEATGGDPSLLVGQWKPIAYTRPDGVKVDLVELPEAERDELSWEFGVDGSVKSGLSIGTFEVKGVTFVATNTESGEARTFRYTVTADRLFVINPAGDALELERDR